MSYVFAFGRETLCGIAVESGFLDCGPLRADPENADFLARPLEFGDHIKIPERRVATLSVATNARHRLARKRMPSEGLRFIHCDATVPAGPAVTLSALTLSNYVTNCAGATGTESFGSGFGDDPTAEADPDTFRVEASTLDQSAALNITLEALRPVYQADGTVARHERFAGPEYAARMLSLDSHPVAGTKRVFRSRYLRLVSDDLDQVAAATQALLVTDTADGTNGPADKVEILDQLVRASFRHSGCGAPAPHQCVLQADLPVGQNPLRLRIVVRVFRSTVHGVAVGGLTEQMIRRRALKWFRRAYAQAGFSVRFVSPEVEFIDPPAASMLTLSQDTGATAAGADSSGNRSYITFRLGAPPRRFDALRRAFDPTVKAMLTPGMTPLAAAQTIIASLPDGYHGDAQVNAQAFNAAGASCDVLITKDDHSRVMIRAERTTDPRMTIAVARVDLTKVDANDTSNTLMASTIEMRRILRCAPGADDHLRFFIVDTFNSNGLRGRAFVPGGSLRGPFAPTAQIRWSVVMAANSSSGPVMDSSDNLPFTFPHEAGHVINDAFHSDNTDPNGPTQLMSGTGTSPTHAVGATKRIGDGPYLVRYAIFNPAQPTHGAFMVAPILVVPRMRRNAATIVDPW